MEKKIAVIYTSKYGSTQTYAEWIAWAVGADLFPARGRREDLLEYDVVVYGGYLHATGIAGLDYIRKNIDALRGKRLIVFSVGVAPIRRDTLDSILAANFTQAERRRIPVFGLRGAFNYHRLRGKDRVMMSLLRAKLRLRHPASLSEDERGLLDAYDHPVNFTDEKTIAPIVRAIRSAGKPIDSGSTGSGREVRKTGAGKTKTEKMARRGRKAGKAKRAPKRTAAKRAGKKRRPSPPGKGSAGKRVRRKSGAARRSVKKRPARRVRKTGGKAMRRRAGKQANVRRARSGGKRRAVKKRSPGKRTTKRGQPRRKKRPVKRDRGSARKRTGRAANGRRTRPGGKRRLSKKRTAGRPRPRRKGIAGRKRPAAGGRTRRKIHLKKRGRKAAARGKKAKKRRMRR